MTERVPNPRPDPLLLDPTRLATVALWAGTEWAGFAFVRDSVQLSDPALSKRISHLSGIGYVEVRKGYVGKRLRAWVNLSEACRTALGAHIATLQQVATQVNH